MQIHIQRYRSLRDLLIEAKAKELAEVTGQSQSLWNRILRWRIRYHQGDMLQAMDYRRI